MISMNIGIFRTDRLGDMILTLPMCKVLKEEYPNARLILFARKENRALLERYNDLLDEVVYEEDFPKWDILTISKVLFRKKIKMVFFPRPRFEELAAAWVARVNDRIGSGYRWYSIFLNHKVFDHRREAKFHEMEYNIRLIGSFLGKELYGTTLIAPDVTATELKNTHIKLEEVSGRAIKEKYIIIHPGSRGSSVDWSIENFGKLATMIYNNYSCDIVITGTSAEKEKCDLVHKFCPESINACGLFSLNELIPFIAKSSLLVANSTGVLHLAAALSVPVIGMYPNDPSICKRRWGPYSKNAITFTPLPEKVNGGWNDDMSLIAVEEVFEGVKKLVPQ